MFIRMNAEICLDVFFVQNDCSDPTKMNSSCVYTFSIILSLLLTFFQTPALYEINAEVFDFQVIIIESSKKTFKGIQKDHSEEP